MADVIGTEKDACGPLKSGFWLGAQAVDKAVETTPFIKGRTTRVVSACNQPGAKHFLCSTLAPHEIGKAVDGVCLGGTGGLPLDDQFRIQICKFPHIFAWDCGIAGEDAMF